ncbi:hypothetical protein Ddc_01732 [Ditylenchus destructor]|nr:hypothetical protein Ddc_01732 [Ditylenchus destructor]
MSELEELKRLLKESEDLIEEAKLFSKEPSCPTEKALLRDRICYINDRTESLKFRFHRLWRSIYPEQDYTYLIHKIPETVRARHNLELEELKQMLKECEDLIEESELCMEETSDPNEKYAYDYRVVQINEEITVLRNQFRKWCKRTYPNRDWNNLLQTGNSKSRFGIT